MKLVPLFDRVVLKPAEKQNATFGGIYLPDSAKEKSEMAEVVAVGAGGTIDGKEIVMTVKAGQKVLFSKYAGSEFKIDGAEYIIVRQYDILAVVED